MGGETVRTNDGSTARLGMTPNRPDRGGEGKGEDDEHWQGSRDPWGPWGKERGLQNLEGSRGKMPDGTFRGFSLFPPRNAMAAHQAKSRHLRTDIRSRRMTYQESEASRCHFFTKSCRKRTGAPSVDFGRGISRNATYWSKRAISMGSRVPKWSSFLVPCIGDWHYGRMDGGGGLKVLQTCSNFKVEIGAWVHATALGKPGGGTRLECSRHCDGPGAACGVRRGRHGMHTTFVVGSRSWVARYRIFAKFA
ncbi:hypothetical protein BDP55DRAFT_31553 [Colletotrichum godetiae]|uniref:Uncharacterized protein n=1 Tax=Colletotrichum godetiae TaxID=1209918 RepID=A0AAJ0EWJ5_9PEZI|nr:uncharacterized protein BDP55DRAFT_31553 [Colletotrichum godetiae]KAK1688825.1 hypothetical protein BDP55DRAFT_31553 [Colletotrichum godetiae]